MEQSNDNGNKTVKLAKQTVVIIGGSSGIGLSTVKLLSSEGANVVAVGRSQTKLAGIAKEYPTVTTAVADITDEQSVQALFRQFDKVDHVIILAGSAIGGRLADTPINALRPAIEERIWGPIYVAKHAAPKMTGGSLTLTSGLFSERPPESGVAVVAAAVGGVESLARALARELAPTRVNAINFGWIRSPHHSFMGDQQEAHYEKVGATLPVGRVGSPEEAADALKFILESEYMTGEVLHLDGGARLV